jgi:hypothetical protein
MWSTRCAWSPWRSFFSGEAAGDLKRPRLLESLKSKTRVGGQLLNGRASVCFLEAGTKVGLSSNVDVVKRPRLLLRSDALSTNLAFHSLRTAWLERLESLKSKTRSNTEKLDSSAISFAFQA